MEDSEQILVECDNQIVTSETSFLNEVPGILFCYVSLLHNVFGSNTVRACHTRALLVSNDTTSLAVIA